MKHLLLAVLFGFFCLAADTYFSDIIITPLLGLCWLMLIARNVGWKTVATVFLILIVFVVASLAGLSAGRILVRTGSFVLAGAMVVAFSKTRQTSLDALSTAHAIIRATPNAMIAADMTGSIVAASDAALTLMPDDFIPLIGHSFADVLLGHLPPGRAMKRYLDWFQAEGARYEELHVRGEIAVASVRARILTTGEGRNRLLVAVLENKAL